jgi:hypothetical protein
MTLILTQTDTLVNGSGTVGAIGVTVAGFNVMPECDGPCLSLSHAGLAIANAAGDTLHLDAYVAPRIIGPDRATVSGPAPGFPFGPFAGDLTKDTTAR